MSSDSSEAFEFRKFNSPENFSSLIVHHNLLGIAKCFIAYVTFRKA